MKFLQVTFLIFLISCQYLGADDNLKTNVPDKNDVNKEKPLHGYYLNEGKGLFDVIEIQNSSLCAFDAMVCLCKREGNRIKVTSGMEKLHLTIINDSTLVGEGPIAGTYIKRYDCQTTYKYCKKKRYQEHLNYLRSLSDAEMEERIKLVCKMK